MKTLFSAELDSRGKVTCMTCYSLESVGEYGSGVVVTEDGVEG